MIGYNKGSLILGLLLSAPPALQITQVCPAGAADVLVVESAPVVSKETVSAAFDVAFGVALTSDYISRGITNSSPAVQPYVEASFEGPTRRIWNG